MLEGLDAIDWTALRHAHGAATDVPGLLRGLGSDDPDARMRACADLHETIWHQGTVYSASPAAVPFLYELLTDPDVQDKGGIVSLIGVIATGDGVLASGLRWGDEDLHRRLLEGLGKTLDEGLAEEAAEMEAIHREVSAGLCHLLPYLGDREGLAPLVAGVLGHFPEHASWLVPAIDAALVSESDERVRKVLAESRARLTSGGNLLGDTP